MKPRFSEAGLFILWPMNIRYTLEEILAIVGPNRTSGTAATEVVGIASLSEAEAGDLSFLGNKKYTPEVKGTQASYVLLPEDYEVTEPNEGQVFVYLENPSLALAKICRDIENRLAKPVEPLIHNTALVHYSAKVDATAHIGPYCIIEAGAVVGKGSRLDGHVYVGRDAVIGRDCHLRPQVSVFERCVLNNRVSLYAGVVVGSDGFGYEMNEGRHEKVPQVGNVVIEDDVEIGANTTIDRARFRSTVIGEGSKLDNLVQIAHNVIIGKHCVVASQAGISGSTVLEDYVMVGGQAGITGHIRLAKGTAVGAQCGLHYNTEPGTYHRGTPGNPAHLANRIDVLRKKLPELFKRVSALEKE